MQVQQTRDGGRRANERGYVLLTMGASAVALFGALGLAVLATVANSRTDELLAGGSGSHVEMTNALNEGFQSAFLVGAGIATLGLVLTLVLIRGKDSRAHVQLGAGAEGQAVGA